MKIEFNKYNIEDFKKLVLLAKNIADKYENQKAYEAALTGLYVGLNLYEKNKRKTKLHLYLVWFIRTSIEYTLGYVNKDTKIWERKVRKVKNN